MKTTTLVDENPFHKFVLKFEKKNGKIHAGFDLRFGGKCIAGSGALHIPIQEEFNSENEAIKVLSEQAINYLLNQKSTGAVQKDIEQLVAEIRKAADAEFRQLKFDFYLL